MKKFLIVCTALFAVVGVAQANYTWTFTNGTTTVDTASNETAIAFSLDTVGLTIGATGSSDDSGISAWNALSGSGTADDSFTMNMEVGFAFDVTAPTYDTTDYSDPAKNLIRFRTNSGVPEGASPLGNGVGWSSGGTGAQEIVHFTIGGLEAGQSFVLKGYSLKENGSNRIDLYYGAGLTFYDTTGGVEDVSGENIVLGNGDQFGLAYNWSAGNRSALQSISFDVIPEPGTVAMFAAGLVGLLGLRRRKR